MITASQLARQREIAERFLPSLCTIYDNAQGQTGDFGIGSNQTVRASNVPCALDAPEPGANPERLLPEGQRGSYTVWILSIPWNTEIATTDTVEVNGSVYQVHSPDAGEEWRTLRRLLVKRRG